MTVRLEDLATPCLVLDRRILGGNLKKMSDIMRKRGVALRPHLKTAKSAEVARLATQNEKGGITVSTLAEAEYFADHGFNDILVAASQSSQKLDRAAALIDRGVTVTLVTDEIAAASRLAAHPAPFRVLIELDSGDHRAGIRASSQQLLEIAAALGGKLEGVMTHAGHSYACADGECAAVVAEEERKTVVTAAQRLGAAGFNCTTVSVGSTPTMTHARSLDGVTEGRPGVYMFQDLYQAAIGTCAKGEIALTVLASVIGRNVEENRVLIDAGALALSKDRSTQSTSHDAGYGEVWGVDGKPSLGNLVVERAYQEHGAVTSAAPLPFERLEHGARVRVAPNHACLTAAAHDRYYVVDGGDEVVAEWDRVNGW
jgi:D-serine deaminase-like pyridoxal phosphate-dependent protein